MGWGMVCLCTGCTVYEGEHYAEPLTETIYALSYELAEQGDCEHLATYLKTWLDRNADVLAKQKKSFDAHCVPGDIVCMSYHILASSRIERVIGECLSVDATLDASLEMDVARLNAEAGIYVRH